MPPSLNCTVPEVTGLPPEVTVAVKVASDPYTDGLGADTTTVVDSSADTTWPRSSSLES